MRPIYIAKSSWTDFNGLVEEEEAKF